MEFDLSGWADPAKSTPVADICRMVRDVRIAGHGGLRRMAVRPEVWPLLLKSAELRDVTGPGVPTTISVDGAPRLVALQWLSLSVDGNLAEGEDVRLIDLKEVAHSGKVFDGEPTFAVKAAAAPPKPPGKS